MNQEFCKMRIKMVVLIYYSTYLPSYVYFSLQTGPYIVYMLREMDVLEDWAAIRKVNPNLNIFVSSHSLDFCVEKNSFLGYLKFGMLYRIINGNLKIRVVALSFFHEI